MALSEDQKAMLRLLAKRGEQGYEDIAALKGIGVEEVRAQARDAVRQLEDEGLPPPALPSGEAPPEQEPPKRAASPERKPPKREAPAESEPPKREAPREGERASAPAVKPAGSKRPRKAPKLGLPADPGLRGALIAGTLIVIALVVILVLNAGGGGSDSTGTTAAGGGGEGAVETPVTSSKKITKAVLSPVDGGNATGSVIFGRIKNKLALQVLATGLEPTAKGQAYAVWLSQSPRKMLPLAATPVGKSGKIAAQFEVPVEVLGYLANETFKDIAITLVDQGDLETSLAAATKAKEAPQYTGTEVLRGTVTGPIVGAASRR